MNNDPSPDVLAERENNARFADDAAEQAQAKSRRGRGSPVHAFAYDQVADALRSLASDIRQGKRAAPPVHVDVMIGPGAVRIDLK